MQVCLEPGCPLLTERGGRCARHALDKRRVAEAGRRSRQARGYDRDHDRARASLALELPAECGYCGRTIRPGEPWVAAHRVDGAPEFGWMHAHPACNEQAKVRRKR